MVSDADLSLRARRGDIRAFEALVEMYKERAYLVALGFVGSHEDAMDLSQEAFARAYRALRTFREGAPFYPWLYAILRNACFNHLRRARTHAEVSLDAAQDAGFDAADDSDGPGRLAERREARAVVRQEMARLEPCHREILLLRHFEDLSYREIAEVLGCPIGTVMSRLYAARRALRCRLVRRLGEEGARLLLADDARSAGMGGRR
jgi:RNA polymerase sigma-70 factor (ECF subfamily)